ncbi:hypothetical protein HMPREF3214_00227 [Alloscardovia omnicolens]|uniref:Uncharacterized protein n=1 Tax=Alloscardovia omnicolens F0580 TaxID=1321816 RepID=U1SLY7_9BIFI|nr:hypothetical protein HMPREF9244_00137 [Alloscardovia omnicolens F0580]KWZ75805.1 hypothetical protein HMPREF3214_00227 [Alloscardovia omnicolens]
MFYILLPNCESGVLLCFFKTVFYGSGRSAPVTIVTWQILLLLEHRALQVRGIRVTLIDLSKIFRNGGNVLPAYGQIIGV